MTPQSSTTIRFQVGALQGSVGVAADTGDTWIDLGEGELRFEITRWRKLVEIVEATVQLAQEQTEYTKQETR